MKKSLKALRTIAIGWAIAAIAVAIIWAAATASFGALALRASDTGLLVFALAAAVLFLPLTSAD
jgi:hypothetical protein